MLKRPAHFENVFLAMERPVQSKTFEMRKDYLAPSFVAVCSRTKDGALEDVERDNAYVREKKYMYTHNDILLLLFFSFEDYMITHINKHTQTHPDYY